MRYFIYLAYLGEAYSGWQIQKNALSVQQIVQEALSKVLSIQVTIWGSGRTDKGVHASNQVAHFDLEKKIPNAPHLLYALNRILPSDVSITAIRPVVPHAHARFDALYRVYEYTLVGTKNPFYKQVAVWTDPLPPLALLNQLAAFFCASADFEYLSKVNKQLQNFSCTVQEATWSQVEDRIVFRIKSNRFLRGMVRVLVGIMLKVGKGKLAWETAQQWMLTKPMERPILPLAPPHGLSLVEVAYPENIFLTHL